MNNSKKILSLILVVVLCFTTIVVSSLTVNGDTATTAFKFMNADYDPSLADKKAPNLDCDDGAMTMKSNVLRQQYQMIFKVDGRNVQMLADAIEEANENYDGALKMEVMCNSAKNAYGGECYPKVDIRLMGANADGSFNWNNIIADTGASRVIPESSDFFTFDVSKFADTPYNYEIKYVYVEVECYDWGCGGGSGTIPNVTCYPIKVDDNKTEKHTRTTATPDPNIKTFFKFSPVAKQDYDPGPEDWQYSPDLTDWASRRTATKDDAGYIQLWNKRRYATQMQVCYNYSGFTDDAKNALNIAKSDGGSGHVKFRVRLDSCVNEDEEPTIAEISYMLTFKKGTESKAPDPISYACWQYPGTTRTYYIDVTNIANYQQLDTVVVRVQNYWYYDQNHNLYDYDAEIRKNGGTPTESDAIAAGYTTCKIKPSITVSPMTVASPDEKCENTDYKLVLNSFNKNGGVVPTDYNKLVEGDPNISEMSAGDDDPIIKPSSTTTTTKANNGGQTLATTISNNNRFPTTVVIPTNSNNSSISKKVAASKPLIKLTLKKKKLTLKLTRKVASVKGYQVKYATNKKFKKAKTKTLKANKKSLVLKGLKSKKTYYVKVRAYTKVNGKKVYSKWSNVAKKKIK